MCLVRSAAAAMISSGERDQFPAGGMMLADPGLVVAEPVQPLEQLDIAVDRQRRVFADAMERCQEDAELHAAMGHCVFSTSRRPCIVQRPAPVAKPGHSWQPCAKRRRRNASMRLEGKVAIVSGAASGMGAATARRFAKEGAKVVIADMLEEDGRKVAAEITRANGTAEFMKLDVTRRGRLEVRRRCDRAEIRQARHPGEQRRHQRQRGDRHAGHRCVGQADGGEFARRVPRHEVRGAGR